jgi:decaprenylphospho-beta-D-erythro-pentofuranosid-2-ulose 2-reductase
VTSVLIIGGTSAIAQAVAHQLAGKGVHFILWGRSRSRLDIVATDLRVRWGVTVDVEAFDFNEFSQYEMAFERAVVREVDLALICHGTLGDQNLCERDLVAMEQEIRLNLLSAVRLLSLLANYFERRGKGCLAAISSVAGDRGRKSNYVYGTAKAALNTFLQGLRNRLYSNGVHVITIKPGFVDTPMTTNLKKGLLFASPEAVARDIVRGIEKKKCVIYTPWFWRWIMLVIKLIPESIFRKLKF